MQCKVSEIRCERILSLSGIDLGEYVINPYRGCQYGCVYCYVQKNKFALKKNMPWGSFVEVKKNAIEQLRKELTGKDVGRVLLGSTTEVYQPCEETYGLMRDILSILNEKHIGCTILTKSPLIMRDCDLLQKNIAPEIYFTISPLPEEVRIHLEPGACPCVERKEAICRLVDSGIPVRVYMNPIIPYVSECVPIMREYAPLVTHIDAESINLKVLPWNMLRSIVGRVDSVMGEQLDSVVANAVAWDRYWGMLGDTLRKSACECHISLRTFFHAYGEYFNSVTYTTEK